MKQLLYILFAFVLFSACTAEDPGRNPDNPGEGVIRFKVTIPAVEDVTRGKDAVTGVNSLYLLVFDQNGRFLSRYQATPAGSTSGSGYTVQMVQYAQPCVIHFVANYDFSAFSDVANMYKDERELIAGLNIQNQVAYWQRITLANISSGTFPATVELIRNIVQVSLKDNTQVLTTFPRLQSSSFAIGNQLQYGSVAPFNPNTSTTSTAGFDMGAATEPAANSFIPYNYGVYSTAPQFMYERKNSVATQPTFVILKAQYLASASAVPLTCYYKIDFIDQGATQLMDLVRNYNYVINVNSVLLPGFATEQQAINAPASNNISASVILQPLLTVSDGVAVLGVQTTNVVLTQPNQTMTIQYAYFPSGTALAQNNTNVTVQLINDDASNPVIPTANFSYSNTTGLITIKTGNMPQALLATGKLIVSCNNLSRTINLQLRYPYPIEAPMFNPNPVLNSANVPLQLSFTIDSIVPTSAFPMQFYVSAPTLTPNNALNTLPIAIQNHTYVYVYTATKTGLQTLYFKTNKATSTSPVQITGGLFSNANLQLNSSATAGKSFVAWFSILPKLMYTNSQVVLYLTLPAGSATAAAPVDVMINTSTLGIDTNNSNTGIMSNVSAVSGGIKYHATTSGSQVAIYLRTSANATAESITVSATGFYSTPNLNQ